jgi:uncharacterized damage-inducible protein DinB
MAAPTQQAKAFDAGAALLNGFAVNGRIDEYMIRNLPGEVWRMPPPGGKGRNIASIAAHMHNVRLMWLRAGGASATPEKLEGDAFSPEEAMEALSASAEALRGVIGAALAGDGRVKGFKPDVGGFVGYLIAHDAHHRGQISMLARQLGHPLPKSAGFGMWEWGTR